MSKNTYIFAGESYMVRESVNNLKGSLSIQYPEMNVTEYKTMPKTDELIEACFSVPFMSDVRFIAAFGCTALGTKGSADDSRKIAEALKKIPDTTVIVLCTEDALDKRRALYTYISKQGTVKEFAAPSIADCVGFVQKKAHEYGASVSTKAASLLIAAVGCDYFALDNETAKLAAYCGYDEITAKHVEECAAKSLEYNVFEIHGLLAGRQTDKAKKLLEDILRTERPEGLIGLIARKIRDMYKVKTMADLKYPASRIAEMTGIKGFVVDILKKESARFTQGDLRDALVRLADLDYGIKSGEADASVALHKTLMTIYKL